MTGSCWRDSRTYSYVGNYQFTEYVHYSSAQRNYRENTPTHIQKKRKLSSSSRQAGTYVRT